MKNPIQQEQTEITETEMEISVPSVASLGPPEQKSEGGCSKTYAPVV